VSSAAHRVLDPLDRISEVLFGLIMVLTFTGSLRVAEAGHGKVFLLSLATEALRRLTRP